MNPLEFDAGIRKSYDPIRRIGRGSYGIVWLATRISDGEKVAIKRIYYAFKDPVDSKRVYREIMILLYLRGHTNIVTLMDVMHSRNDQDLYLVMDCFDTDMYTLLRNTHLTTVHKQYTIYQIFRALKYVHSASVVFRDLKPTNILVNKTCTLKLCDFGYARLLNEEEKDNPDGPRAQTDYVSSRWYRAPELITGCSHYDFSIDMWAAGCVIGEIFSSRPLFCATSTLDLLYLIVSFTGKPSDYDIKSLNAAHAETMLGPMQRQPSINLSKRFPNINDEGLDLIRLCMQFNPMKRLTATEALGHPYVGNFANPDDEPSVQEPIKLALDDYDQYLSSTYRDQIYADVMEIPRSRRRLGYATKTDVAPEASDHDD